MREMKDSGIEWIGEIPKEWNLVRIKNLITARDGGAWGEEPTGEDGDLICLRIADFDYSRYCFKAEGELTTRHYKKDVINRLQLKQGDILIEKSGGGEKTPVGRAVLFDKDYPALFANFMDRVRCAEDVNPYWVLFNLANLYSNNYTKPYIKQTTGIQNLDIQALLSSQYITMPPDEVQKKILDIIFSESVKVDTLVSNVTAQIGKLKQYKQSLITEVATKGLDPNVPMKDSGAEWIGAIPAHWSAIPINALFRIKKDIIGHEPDCVLSITQQGIKEKDISVNEGQMAANYEKYQIVNVGDFAMNHMDLLTGGVGISEYEGVTSPDYRVFVLRDTTMNPRFFLHIFLMYYRNKIFYAFGQGAANVGRWRLPAQNFKTTCIPLAPVEEQNAIVEYLDARFEKIDRLISIKQAKIEKLNAYRKSLIYEYVTGKKEVM